MNVFSEAVLTYHNLCFEQKKRKVLFFFFHLKIIIFTAIKIRSILHRRFIVMFSEMNYIGVQENQFNWSIFLLL